MNARDQHCAHSTTAWIHIQGGCVLLCLLCGKQTDLRHPFWHKRRPLNYRQPRRRP